MSPHAPVAYFAYNRPQHGRRTLAALAANPEAPATDLHIFIDGPRTTHESAAVQEMLQVAHAVSGFHSVTVHESPKNEGLYRSITAGVSQVVSSEGRVIVVEDDILVSRQFLAYMNDALESYADQTRVGCIHGYCPGASGFPDFFFLRGADCWGWATWADRWQLYRADTSNLVSELVAGRQLEAFLAIYGHHSLVHLIKRAEGRNQSWAANWHASLFLADRLTLHPGRSFVQNIGNDGSGTHSATSDLYATPLSAAYEGIPAALPLAPDPHATIAMRRFMDQRDHEDLVRKLRRYAATIAFTAKARIIHLRHRSRHRASVHPERLPND